MKAWTHYALMLLAGLLGAGVFYLGLLAYQDHALLNDIRADLARQQAAQAQQIRQFQAQQAPGK